MTDPDDKLRERYRRLGNEEPPPALDAAILASARRAVSRPSAMRWSGPVSIAAVLVLAVGVTLRMRQEEPGIETSMPSEYSTPAPAEPTAPAPQFEESRRALDATREADAAPKAAAPAPKPAPAPKAMANQMTQQAQPRDRAEAERKDVAPERQQAKKEDAQAFADKPAKLSVAPEAPIVQPEAAPPSVAATAAPPPAARADSLEQRSAAGAAAPSAPSVDARAKRAAPAQAQLAKEASTDPLLRELERIATLRREGRHAEADKALEEFRRLNPDYRIPDPVWEQVKPR